MRLHAAEGLAESGEQRWVSERLRPVAMTAPPKIRIVVWRALARCEPNHRAEWIARIREVLRDHEAPDRIHAAESLAKLKSYQAADRPFLEQLVATSEPSVKGHPLWLLALSGQPEDEARLAALLKSSDPIARLVAAYGLGRMPARHQRSIDAIRAAAKREDSSSLAAVYLNCALFRLATPQERTSLKERLIESLSRGSDGDKYEVSLTLADLGTHEDLPRLAPRLKEPGDPAIGAAQASLAILKRVEAGVPRAKEPKP